MRCSISSLAIVASLILPGVARSTVQESFESLVPTWQVSEHDCALRMEEHRRTFDVAHSGRGSEYLHYGAGQGTKLYLTHVVSRSRVIDELTPSLWVKSNRSGVQLFVRVVLPRTQHPRSGEPMTVLLPGDSCDAPGTWQHLRVTDLPTQVEREVRLLRAHFGIEIDTGEAYIDLVVLNAYAGTGVNELWTDDLEIAGFASTEGSTISVNATASSLPNMAGATGGPATPASVRIRGSLVTVNESPIFVRGIEWHGERLSQLVKLGINVALLDRPPTEEEAAEAQRLGIWLVAPPPADIAHVDSTTAEVVLSWMVGEQLATADRDAFSRRTALLRRDSQEPQRPICGDVLQDLAAFADDADLLTLRRRPIGTSQQLADSTKWWQRQLIDAGTTPCWSSIQTEFSESQLAQISGLKRVAAEATHVEPDQIWLQVCHAIAAGSRGIVYRSDRQLDGDDPSSRQRAAAIHLSNLYLSIIEPWIAAANPGRASVTDSAGWTAATLEGERSLLLLVMQATADQQFCVGDLGEQGPVVINVPSRRMTDQAYRISAGGLLPLRTVSAAHAGRVSIADAGLVNLIVLTDDPLVVSHLARRSRDARVQLKNGHLAIARAQLTELEEVMRAAPRGLITAISADRNVHQVAVRLARANQQGDARDAIEITRSIQSIEQQIRHTRHALWQQAALQFPHPLSSPFCTALRLLPAHWQLAQRLHNVNWGPNQLAAGRFEDLAHLLETGWAQNRSQQRHLESKVELSLDAPRTGRTSLKLQVWSELAEVRPIRSWPVWITSAPVPVVAGQLVRIHGWVKVPEVVQRSDDGLLIFDSLSGVDFAARIQSTRGWQEFTLYRIAPSGGELTMVLAMTGLGTAYIDDLEISVLSPQ